MPIWRISSELTEPSLLSETGEVSIPRTGPQMKSLNLAEIIQVPTGSANICTSPG